MKYFIGMQNKISNFHNIYIFQHVLCWLCIIQEVDKKFSDNCKYLSQLKEELSILRKENNSLKSGSRTSNDKMVLIMVILII